MDPESLTAKLAASAPSVNLLARESRARRYVPSTKPQRGQRGAASRVEIVCEHRGQRQGAGASHDQGQDFIAAAGVVRAG